VPYDAFISYSHAADGLFAPRLQDGLQRFAKPWYRRRSLHVFRDETGLSVNPGLWTSIATAIDESKYFVLLASPEAAQSDWVNREVEHWVSQNGPHRMLCVLTDGDWIWDSAANDFDFAASTAVPVALAGAFAEEPRHVDMRWARDETQLDLHNGQFRDSVAVLAATIHGVAKDDLAGLDVSQHRRTVRIAWGTAILLLLLTMLAGSSALAAAHNASKARAAQHRADQNAAEAQTNANDATQQRTIAQTNARTADANAARAAQQQQLAESNAQEAQNNADEAQANADDAQTNAAEANRQRSAALASAEEARLRQEDADRNAAEAQAQREAATRAADQLAQQNVALDAASKANAALAQANAEALQRQTALSNSLNGAQLTAFAESERAKGNFDTAMLVAARAMDVSPDPVPARNEAFAVQQSMTYVDRYLSGPSLSSTFSSTMAFAGQHLLGADIGGTTAEVWDMSKPDAPPKLLDVSSMGTITNGALLSPDGTRAVIPVAISSPIAAAGTNVTVWDTTTGTELFATPPSEAVDLSQVSPDGTLLAVQEGTFDDPHAVVLDLATARPVFDWNGFLFNTFSVGCHDVAGPGNSCGFSADSRYVLAQDNGEMVLFDRQHPRQETALYTPKGFDLAPPAPRFLDGGQILGVPDSRTISVFALDGTLVRTIPLTNGAFANYALSSDRRTVVMMDSANDVFRIDPATGASVLLTQLPPTCAANLDIIMFSPDGSWVSLLISSQVCDSVLYYVPTTAPLDAPPSGHSGDDIVAWGRDATNSDRYAISVQGNVYDTATGVGSSLEWNHLGECTSSPSNDRLVCGDLVLGLNDFTPTQPIARSVAPFSLKAFDDQDNARLFGVTPNGRVIVIDTSRSGPGELTFHEDFSVGPADDPVLFTTLSPDHTRVAVGTATSVTILGSGIDPVFIKFESPWKFVTAQFVEDGQRLLVTRQVASQDTVLADSQVIDVSNGNVLGTFGASTSVSGDGHVIEVVNGDRLEIRNASDLTVRSSFPSDNFPFIGSLNDNGTLMSAFVGDEIILFDTTTGAMVNSRFTGTAIYESQFSTDGSRIALVSDHDVAVVDAFSLNDLIRDRDDLGNSCPNAAPSQAVRVQWSPDSTLLVVDKSVLDARTLAPIGAPLSCDAVGFGHGRLPTFDQVVRTPQLALDSITIDVRSLPVSAADLRARGCDLAGRDFTEAEWERFNPGVGYTATCPH
jgi:hypothetical protein